MIQFTCGHCGYDVPRVKGTAHNHCPKCLWSKHVGFGTTAFDDFTEPCGGMMAPTVNRKRQTLDHTCVCGYRFIGVPVKRFTRTDFSSRERVFVPGKTPYPEPFDRLVRRLVASATPPRLDI